MGEVLTGVGLRRLPCKHFAGREPASYGAAGDGTSLSTVAGRE